VRRFNSGGIAALDDEPRAGRPRTHTEDRRGALVALARRSPCRSGIRSRCGPKSGCATPSGNGRASDSASARSGAGWRPRVCGGNASRPGSSTLKSTIRASRKKGGHHRRLREPPPDTRVICIDELGPLGITTYAGQEWVARDRRATFAPDYGRRDHALWVHGAFEPATGQASILITERRDSASHIALLEQMIRDFPAERWRVIDDNLSTHRGRQTALALWAWPEITVLPLRHTPAG